MSAPLPQWLDTSKTNFQDRFDALVADTRLGDPDVGKVVSAILEEVRSEGDVAILRYTELFDRMKLLSASALAITFEEVKEAIACCPSDHIAAINQAADRIEAFHQRQYPSSDCYTDDTGAFLSVVWRPVASVGLYVPGGTATYPSSVLMNAIPAKIAGVARIVMVVPTPEKKLNPLVLAAARRAGVNEIYRVGGAQAIGALAYGTETIAPVDKIVGPGNAYVAAAKRQLFGTVGIDSIAGPSEILVLADDSNDPSWVAADLLSQAEHDEAAQAILITDSEAFAIAVVEEVERQLVMLTRKKIAEASWRRYGAVIIVRNFAEAIPLINRLAPEHLEIAVPEPELLAYGVRNAGVIFLGHYTPEAIGDYVIGSNHVLPTGRTASFASGLGVLDFMKRTSIVRCDAEAFGQLGPIAATLAETEGLSAHQRSLTIRMNQKQK